MKHVASSYEHGNRSSVSVKFWNFLIDRGSVDLSGRGFRMEFLDYIFRETKTGRFFEH
jgi:hypothetical protein